VRPNTEARPRWWSPLVEMALFALALVLAWKLGRVTDWDNQELFLALRTPYWPFYVLKMKPPVWTARVVFPVAAFGIASVALRGRLRGGSGRVASLVFLVVSAWLFHLTLAIEHHGFALAFTDTFLRPGVEYWQDVPLVVHGFLARFPDVGDLSVHGSTHPPGLPLLLAGLDAIGLHDARDAELVCSTFAALTALPLYGAARRLAGEPSARMATALFLFACSINAFAVLAMDTATMFFAALSLYGMARALDGERTGAVLLGLGLFVASMCNFIALVLGLTFVLLLAARWPVERRVWRVLALAVALFFAAYALLWIGFGYRPVYTFRRCMVMFKTTSVNRLRSRRAAHLGTPIAFLGALGLPLGALAARAIGGAALRLVRRESVRPALIVLAGAAPWIFGAAVSAPRGEVEHAYLLFVPMTVIAASLAARQWYVRGERWLRFVALPLLALQSILVEVYLSTYW
jgi:methylthioxylose transferase